VKGKEIIEVAGKLFAKRSTLESLWQEIAEHFYPERADFTVKREFGEEFAADLETSYPLLARRDLGNAIGTMLRPRGMEWFELRLARPDREDNQALRWMQWAASIQRRAMYDKRASFVRATKEGDNDWAAFGQAVISVEMNAARDALLFRSWHLGNVAWLENADGMIDTVYRRWKPERRQMIELWGKHPRAKLSEKIIGDDYEKRKFETVNCLHCIMPTEKYEPPVGEPRSTKQYVSLHIDVDHEEIILTEFVDRMIYVIPRWQTVSGSQYAHSPATVCALPEARLLQSMTGTLLEAGEKATNPPLIATQEAIAGNIATYAGGVTWADAKYDERLGDVLRPITQDLRGIPLGMELRLDTRDIISEAFFLSKIALPLKNEEMTAFEVQQRVTEFIRNAAPLFEPMEDEYNGQLCEESFAVLQANGGFGSPFDMPRSLQGQETVFQFQSPLRDAYERQKGQKFLETKQMLAQAVELDPATAYMVDARESLRDVLNGLNVPARWMRPERQVTALAEEERKKQQANQLLADAAQAGKSAKAMGEGAAAMGDAARMAV
tara:strand:- start:2648 stop:4306 length:1659 start_codon:yes stop_codon:yes gene_type:complete